jgi:hypothetical protein
MTALLHAHSGLRFLILLLGVVNILVLGGSLVMKKPFGKVHRILGASFAGSLHLQVLLGLSLVAMGDWFPALIGHLTMMILAAVAAQVAMTMNRKRPRPGLQIPLAGVVIALLFIVGGVMAIGRHLFAMTITGG